MTAFVIRRRHTSPMLGRASGHSARSAFREDPQHLHKELSLVTTNITRILYIEDDPGLARLLQKILQRRGFVIDTAANGEEGIAMLAASPYELLLLDYNMPFMGGMDVLRALAAQDRLLPTIMVTGEGNESIAVEALKRGEAEAGIDEHLVGFLRPNSDRVRGLQRGRGGAEEGESQKAQRAAGARPRAPSQAFNRAGSASARCRGVHGR